MYFNYHALPNIVCSLLLLFLGYFVFFKKRSKTNFIFLLLTLSAAMWQLGTFLMLLSDSQSVAYFWSRMTVVAVTFIPVTLFHFVVSILDLKKMMRYVSILYAIALFMFLPLIYSGVFLK
ncbi:histidine kinase N-terminal 7TM domain-containing protein, partial [Candidatus Margulisiibacteriota bacterium]